MTGIPWACGEAPLAEYVRVVDHMPPREEIVVHLHPFRVGARSLRDFARKWGAERTGRPAHPVHAPSRCRSSVRANVIIVTSARFANLAIRFPHTTSKTVLANRHSVAYVRSVSLGCTFVQVSLLVNKKSGARHAVKILDDRLDTEITIFQQLEHKNIVRFIRSFGPCPIRPGQSSGGIGRALGISPVAWPEVHLPTRVAPHRYARTYPIFVHEQAGLQHT